MTTQDIYDAGTAAALAIVNADIQKDVPSFFQSEISEDMKQEIASTVARAAIDAADAARVKAAQEGQP